MFTYNLKQIVQDSLQLSSAKSKSTTEELLISLLKHQNSLGAKILEEQGLHLGKIPSLPLKKKKKIAVSPLYQKALLRSAQVALKYKSRFIGSAHLLYSLLTLKKSKACQILTRFLGSPETLKENLLILIQNNAQEFQKYSKIFKNIAQKSKLKKSREDKKHPPSKKNILDIFCLDLVQEATRRKIGPLIGREKEMERMINILMRRNKNNPLLIGAPGVGKTALVEGLAFKIAHQNVPPYFIQKRILCLDLAALVAGTIFRGEFEARLQKIIEEVERDKDIILFIDEIHNIIGAGSASGSLDTANILKAPLTRGGFQCIGATTLEEYQKHLEKDRALERRFQKIIINEPAPEQTLKILKGTKKEYEQFHQIKISNQALKEAVDLSHRFINDRFLPDKALDLLDEALAHLRNKLDLPNNLKTIKQKEEELKKLAYKKIEAVKQENFTQALKFKKKQDKIKQALIRAKERMEKTKLKFYGQLNAQEIQKTAERITEIPLVLLKKEKKTLLSLEKHISQKIIGQNKILKDVCSLIRKAKAGLASENKPLASFLFLGPSGVGKTELAKVLAQKIFGDEKNLIRLDMSEFKESFSSSRLIGAPAGYVGYEEGGLLTEKVRHQPYSLILFDEIEKAHPKVLNFLLQILEEGVLNDHKGHQVNFKNTIIVMTSNLGTDQINKNEERIGFMDQISQERDQKKIKTQIQNSLKEFLKPELLNRIDKVLIFNSLNLKDLEKIAKLEINKLCSKLKKKKITLKASPRVPLFLAKKVKKENLGARPLQRLISTLIEDKIAKLLLEGRARQGTRLILSLSRQGKIKINYSNA